MPVSNEMKITDALRWMQMFLSNDNWKRENAVNACSEQNWFAHDDILIRFCKVVLIKGPIWTGGQIVPLVS